MEVWMMELKKRGHKLVSSFTTVCYYSTSGCNLNSNSLRQEEQNIYISLTAGTASKLSSPDYS